MNKKLEELEKDLAVAKAAGDTVAIRGLLSEVNAARREAREAEATRLAELSSQGLNPDGSKMTLNDKLFAAIGF